MYTSTNLCFPDRYKPHMERSLEAFLERVRVDLLDQVLQQRAAHQMTDGRGVMNGPGRSVLSDSIGALYECNAENTLRNLHWGGA